MRVHEGESKCVRVDKGESEHEGKHEGEGEHYSEVQGKGDSDDVSEHMSKGKCECEQSCHIPKFKIWLSHGQGNTIEMKY